MKIALVGALLAVALSPVAQAQVSCTASTSKKISIKTPAVFTGTLEDDKNIFFVKKSVMLTSLGLDKAKKAPEVAQSAVTDSRGAFHFDSVPAGKYAIAIDFSGWAMKKAEVHCTPNNSCSVALVVRPLSRWDCQKPPDTSDLLPQIRQ